MGSMRRLLVWLSAVPLALVLGVVLYAGLVRTGLAPNPFAPVVRGDFAQARSERAGLRVLFVGNSFTYENDLPGIVHRLAGDGAPIFAVSFTAPGWRLRSYARDRKLARLLREVRWDYVVLQEQSQIPSFSSSERAREFDPYARALTQEVAAAKARPLLFLTWGYRTGDRGNQPGDTYALMQERLLDGYSEAAAVSGVSIAPVGRAWEEALARRPQLGLWAGDGRHPSRMGSYPAACVLYATLTGRTPVGDRFSDGLDAADARFLQQVAWETARA
jgi:hypothetical protein